MGKSVSNWNGGSSEKKEAAVKTLIVEKPITLQMPEGDTS